MSAFGTRDDRCQFDVQGCVRFARCSACARYLLTLIVKYNGSGFCAEINTGKVCGRLLKEHPSNGRSCMKKPHPIKNGMRL
jgi:hypothetical protein